MSILAQKSEKSNSKIRFFRGSFGFQYVHSAHTEEIYYPKKIDPSGYFLEFLVGAVGSEASLPKHFLHFFGKFCKQIFTQKLENGALGSHPTIKIERRRPKSHLLSMVGAVGFEPTTNRL